MVITAKPIRVCVRVAFHENFLTEIEPQTTNLRRRSTQNSYGNKEFPQESFRAIWQGLKIGYPQFFRSIHDQK